MKKLQHNAGHFPARSLDVWCDELGLFMTVEAKDQASLEVADNGWISLAINLPVLTRDDVVVAVDEFLQTAGCHETVTLE